MSHEIETSRKPATSRPPRTHRFLVDTVWTWASVGANLLTGLVLSPYIIRKLGADGYGLWSLVFSIVGYYAVMDLGFRSAVITMTAEYEARGERDKINVLLSSTLAYSIPVALALLGVSAVLVMQAPAWFHVSEHFHAGFRNSLAIAGFTVALTFVFNPINGCLEGLQKFRELNQLRAGVLLLRALASAAMLWAGYGLLGLTLCALGSGVIGTAGYWRILRASLPGLRIRRSLVSFGVFREAAVYGFHTTVAGIGQVAVEQTPTVLIGRMVSAAAVGFYSLPFRLLQYPVEMVTRVTTMLAPVAAEFGATNRAQALARLAVLANRYSLALYAPFSLVLLTWGTDIIRLWVGAEYARASGPLLIYFVLSVWLAMAGQSTSVSLLFGLRAHRWYGAGLLGEGIALAVGIWLTVRQGLVPAAAVTAAAMMLNRGLLVPWVVCRRLETGFAAYMFSIYLRPLLLAAPLYGLLYVLRTRVEWRITWFLLIAVSAATLIVYLAAAYFLCLDRAHRGMALSLLGGAKARLGGAQREG